MTLAIRFSGLHCSLHDNMGGVWMGCAGAGYKANGALLFQAKTAKRYVRFQCRREDITTWICGTYFVG